MNISETEEEQAIEPRENNVDIPPVPKLVGINDIDLELLVEPPKFTEPATLKAMEILGYAPEDLVLITREQFDSIPGGDGMKARVLGELDKRRAQIINGIIAEREKVIERQKKNIPTPKIQEHPDLEQIPKAHKKKRRKGKKGRQPKTIDGSGSPVKRKKRRKFRAAKTLDPILPDDRASKLEEKKYAEQQKRIKELEKKNAEIEKRIQAVETQRRNRAIEMHNKNQSRLRAASQAREKVDKEAASKLKKTMNRLKGADHRRAQLIAERKSSIAKKKAEEERRKKSVEKELQKAEKERQKKAQEAIKRQERAAKRIEEERKAQRARIEQRRRAEVLARLRAESKNRVHML